MVTVLILFKFLFTYVTVRFIDFFMGTNIFNVFFFLDLFFLFMSYFVTIVYQMINIYSCIFLCIQVFLMSNYSIIMM